MAQKANTEPGEGDLDFSDGELSEMGADVVGREPGVKRKRPTLRVPVDEVRRAAAIETDSPKVGITTEPSLPAFQADASDDVVENAFVAGGVADGDVPCVRDFAEAIHADDHELEPGGMRPMEIGETEVRTLEAEPEDEDGHIEIETDPRGVQAVPGPVDDLPTKPLPEHQVSPASPLAALVRAVSTSGPEPGMASPTSRPPSLDAIDQPVWSSAPPPPASAETRPVLVGETTRGPAAAPPSAQALASAVVARAQRGDDEEELDGAELEEDDGAEAEKEPVAAARPRTMTPLPPMPPPDRPRAAGQNSAAIPLNGNGSANGNANATSTDPGRSPTLPGSAPSLFAPPVPLAAPAAPGAAPPIPQSAHVPTPRPADPSIPNVLPPPTPTGGPASPPAVPSLPGMPPPTPSADGAQARPPVPPAAEPARPPGSPPAPPAPPVPRDRSLTPSVPINAAAAAAPGADLPLRTRKRRRAKQWYEEIFDDDYLRTLPFLTPRQTEREAQFVTESLGLPAGSAVLDLACGYGRHAMELAGKGYKVTGLDLSLPLLIRAADTARRASLNINFIHGDMREMTFDNEFDGAYSMFTSFGYFDDDTNRKVAGNLARAIKPGGKLLIDVVNRDYLCRDLPTRVWWQGEGCVILEEVDFNYFSSRLQVQRSIIFEDGRQVEQEISIRAYSLHEIGKVLHHSGFRVTEVSGGLALRGKFFGAQSRQLLVLAEKKGQP